MIMSLICLGTNTHCVILQWDLHLVGGELIFFSSKILAYLSKGLFV